MNQVSKTTQCYGNSVREILRRFAFINVLILPTCAVADPLIQPPICSTVGADSTKAQFPFCRISSAENGSGTHIATLSLTATGGPINVGGYRVTETLNYDGGYLPPVVEVEPGDLLKVRLLNSLAAGQEAPSMRHSAMTAETAQPTNLHTHGLIVSPKNSRGDLRQNGDNIFATLNRGQSLDYSIEIPKAIPASILDGKKGSTIPHPSGLYWYHSHLHGVSAKQVSGGMSGLLSVGPRDANVVATDPTQTAVLKNRTDVLYLMLRDIQITSATAPPQADGSTRADWISDTDPTLCQPDANGALVPPSDKREGYCQNAKDDGRIWLFTINGQRFPTIDIASGRNHLWRLANLSASASYRISVRDSAGRIVPFRLISIDGVVPGTPQVPSSSALRLKEAALVSEPLLLMPAARAEIFVENNNADSVERRLVLQTDGVDTSMPGTTAGDQWPAIKLADVVLDGSPRFEAAAVRAGLNAAFTIPEPAADTHVFRTPAIEALPLPIGCARDIDRTKLEHRRIEFAGSGDFSIDVQIVHPRDRTKLQPYSNFDPDPSAAINYVSFDRYMKDGAVDWNGTGDGSDPKATPRHTCVRLGSGHGQLWEISNPTAELHNFHLHQTKFRLAGDEDLRSYGIDPTSVKPASLTIEASLSKTVAVQPEPREGETIWHDTLPIAPSEVPVFIIINFDTEEQLGRYVFHCHILEHEDHGLMAPIEVVP